MADMIYRELGRTGLKVSIVGYGASPLGAEFGQIDPAEGTRAVHCAIDHGINYFDVAPYYGRTLAESRLGDTFGLTVLGVIREGTTRLVPRPTERLLAGDTLLIEGTQEDLVMLNDLQN